MAKKIKKLLQERNFFMRVPFGRIAVYDEN